MTTQAHRLWNLRTGAKQVSSSEKPANPSGMRSLRSRSFASFATPHAIARAREEEGEEGFPEFPEPVARPREGDEELSDRAWLSQRSRRIAILDVEF